MKNCCFFSSKWIWALPPPLTVTFHVITFFVLASLLSPDVTFAAKGYFDALVRMGELASESQGSKDLGKWLLSPGDLTCFPSLSLSVCLSLRVVAFGLGHAGLSNKQHQFVIHRRHPTSASCAGEALRGTRVGWCRRCFFLIRTLDWIILVPEAVFFFFFFFRLCPGGNERCHQR